MMNQQWCNGERGTHVNGAMVNVAPMPMKGGTHERGTHDNGAMVNVAPMHGSRRITRYLIGCAERCLSMFTLLPPWLKKPQRNSTAPSTSSVFGGSYTGTPTVFASPVSKFNNVKTGIHICKIRKVFVAPVHACSAILTTYQSGTWFPQRLCGAFYIPAASATCSGISSHVLPWMTRPLRFF